MEKRGREGDNCERGRRKEIVDNRDRRRLKGWIIKRKREKKEKKKNDIWGKKRGRMI